jgi:hypothetical protein
MVNVNIFDMVCGAVEDFNNYVSRRNTDGLSYDERRGLVYNCFRRAFGTLYRQRRDSSSLKSQDLDCTFDGNGRLVRLKITKDFYAGYSDWDADLERLNVLRMLREVVNTHQQFYQSRELNDMARIINSIKTT